MPSKISRRKRRLRSLEEVMPHEVPWRWRVLAILGYTIVLLVVLGESAVHHRHPTEISDPTRVDINYGTQEQIESLPGIGPSLARAIIAARPFSAAEEIARVKGIGPKSATKLRPLIKAAQGRRTADLR